MTSRWLVVYNWAIALNIAVTLPNLIGVSASDDYIAKRLVSKGGITVLSMAWKILYPLMQGYMTQVALKSRGMDGTWRYEETRNSTACGRDTSNYRKYLVIVDFSRQRIISRLCRLFSRFETWCRNEQIVPYINKNLIYIYLLTKRWEHFYTHCTF